MSFHDPEQILKNIERQTSMKFSLVQTMSGACSNLVMKVARDDNTKFIAKVGSKNVDVYEIEAKSLNLISAKCPSLRIPKVECFTKDFLLIEYINRGSGSRITNINQLHANHSLAPGLEFNTHLGHFIQENDFHDLTWPDFYWRTRIKPLWNLCKQKDLCNSQLNEILHRVEECKNDLLRFEGPFSLLHGDLWDGNYFTDENGHLVLIDPAISYGDPLCDIAMLELFGSTHRSEVYQNSLSDEQDLRIGIYKGYYLLYHLWDCGRSYLSSCISEFSRLL